MLRENSGAVKGFVRALQVLFVIVAIFGAVWKSTLSLALSIQEFMMLYGVAGAAVCEAIIRVLDWKFPEPEDGERQSGDESTGEEENGGD